jgi:hypothetical protein
VFIALTSGVAGLNVYLNGVLAKQASDLQIARSAFQGRLILGDAPMQPDAYRGEIRGVAIYDTELSSAQVLTHYETWRNNGRPNMTVADRISALYLMREGHGSIIHNEIKPGMDLVIPQHYVVLGKIALEPIWKEFELSRSYGSAALKNVIGFVPLGLCFYIFMVVRQRKRPVFTTIIAGFLVSLMIEVLQIFLPTRDSGTTDLVTNTLGTWLGVLGCRWIAPSRLLRPFPK